MVTPSLASRVEGAAGAACSTCAYWTRTHSGYEFDAERMVERGDCSRIIASPARRMTGARIAPTNHSAWLSTFADFGCTEHRTRSGAAS